MKKITIVRTVLSRDCPEMTKLLITGREFNQTQVETKVVRNAFNE